MKDKILLTLFSIFMAVWIYYAVFFDPLEEYNRRKIEYNQERIDQLSNDLDSVSNAIRHKIKTNAS